MSVAYVKGRRTHSVHHSREEAKEAAYSLGRLMNGVPVGYVFCIQERLGKWAFISLPAATLTERSEP